MTHSSLKKFTQELNVLMPSVMRGVLKNHPTEMCEFLTPHQLLILDLLNKKGPMMMTEIAREMGFSFPAATGVVTRLHSFKMVARVYDKEDRRIIRIVLTQKAKKLINRIRYYREKIVNKIFGKLTEKERQSYLSILKKVNDALYKKSV